MPIKIEDVRQLDLKAPSTQDTPAFVSAASGLVHAYEKYFVVVDDSLELAIFPDSSQAPGWTHPLFKGTLPLDPGLRKKLKPDLESIAFLAPHFYAPYGALLAVPSGSKSNRMWGSWIAFNESGDLISQGLTLNFEDLFLQVKKDFPELNIEGAIISSDQLKLFQRGNGPANQNGIISLDLAETIQGIIEHQTLFARSIRSIKTCELGSLGGAKLGFTDAACGQAQEIWFLAAAESSPSTYDDGAYTGSVLGCLNAQDEIIFVDELLCPDKPEGLCIMKEKGIFMLVTDADDPHRAATLFSGHLPSLPMTNK